MSEALQSDPSVTIAGETATVSSSGNDYTATYDVTSSSTEGAVTMTLVLSLIPRQTPMIQQRQRPVLPLTAPHQSSHLPDRQRLRSVRETRIKNKDRARMAESQSPSPVPLIPRLQAPTPFRIRQPTRQGTKERHRGQSLSSQRLRQHRYLLSCLHEQEQQQLFHGRHRSTAGSTITKYQIKRDAGSYADIPGSDDSTTSHT